MVQDWFRLLPVKVVRFNLKEFDCVNTEISVILYGQLRA